MDPTELSPKAPRKTREPTPRPGPDSPLSPQDLVAAVREAAELAGLELASPLASVDLAERVRDAAKRAAEASRSASPAGFACEQDLIAAAETAVAEAGLQVIRTASKVVEQVTLKGAKGEAWCLVVRLTLELAVIGHPLARRVTYRALGQGLGPQAIATAQRAARAALWSLALGLTLAPAPAVARGDRKACWEAWAAAVGGLADPKGARALWKQQAASLDPADQERAKGLLVDRLSQLGVEDPRQWMRGGS